MFQSRCRSALTAGMLASCLMAAPVAAQEAMDHAGHAMPDAPDAVTTLPVIERHTGPNPGLILQGITVRPGATMLFLSG